VHSRLIFWIIDHMMNEFKQIKSDLIYQGRVFNVRQDQVQFPNGRMAKLDIIEHPPAVLIVPIDESGNILFIRQYRHATGKVILELPAGVVEDGETPEVCARREIREETGMSARSVDTLGGYYMVPGYSTEYLHVFLARDLQHEPLPGDEDEFIDVVRIPVFQAYAQAEAGEIHDSKTLAALLLAKPHLNQ